MTTGLIACADAQLPSWVPEDARHYIIHTQFGRSIRSVAREAGCHASTVMRQVHKLESRRDDPLIDEALSRLGKLNRSDLHVIHAQPSEAPPMSRPSPAAEAPAAPDSATIERETRRILRRLSEPGACLAVAQDMEKAVVVRDLPDGRTNRTAVLDREIAQAMALKGWIASDKPGRVAKYRITQAGRAELRNLLAAEETARAGFHEGAAGEATQRWLGAEDADEAPRGRARYCVQENPIQALARRRDRDGKPFLPSDLVRAAERLHEDFALAGLEQANVAWDSFIAAGAGTIPTDAFGKAQGARARARVARVLSDLGPGLGDVVLRCCCHLEGLESAEKRMGWSARSGKIVLRIALQRLRHHYAANRDYDLIG